MLFRSLDSLQTRIDPEFVFRTLSKLEVLYESDPQAADRLLQELIVFLRSALADIHSANASVAPAQARERAPLLTVT